MKRWSGYMAVVLAAVVSSVVAAEPEDSLLGAWVNQADASDRLEFFGNGIGEEAHYFTCTFPATNQVSVNYGGGTTESFTLAFINGALHWTDGQGATKIYTSTTATAGCTKNLKQFAGAKAVFAADRPEVERPTLRDLVGAYLSALPDACPDGGLYLVGATAQNPACSVHGPL